MQDLTTTVTENNFTSTTILDSVESIRNVIKNVNTINNFMMMTINRCIDYTKASRGVNLAAKVSSFNLRDTLELPCRCVSDLLVDGTILEQISIDEAIAPHIISDQQWLQENVLCLLSNSCRYSSHGSIKVNVYLAHRKEIEKFSYKQDQEQAIDTQNAQFLVVEVEDHGIGIKQEIQEKLFYPFKQAQRLAGGTGLGLYSLAKRVSALNGFNGVRNRRDGDEGALIWFAIPYKPDFEYAATAEPLIQPDQLIENHARKLKILIVDDVASIAKMCYKVLSNLGHDVVIAQNGAIAIEKVKDLWNRNLVELGTSQETVRNFDVILMDLQMPVMDGIEATERIRAFEVEKGILRRSTIIGVSGHNDKEIVNIAFSAGVNDFVSKPFGMKELQERVEQLAEL